MTTPQIKEHQNRVTLLTALIDTGNADLRKIHNAINASSDNYTRTTLTATARKYADNILELQRQKSHAETTIRNLTPRYPLLQRIGKRPPQLLVLRTKHCKC